MLRAVAIALFCGLVPPAIFWTFESGTILHWIVVGGTSAAVGSYWAGWYSRYFYAIWPFIIVGCYLGYPNWSGKPLDPVGYGLYGLATITLGGLLPGLVATKIVEEQLAARGLIFPNGRTGDDENDD